MTVYLNALGIPDLAIGNNPEDPVRRLRTTIPPDENRELETEDMATTAEVVEDEVSKKTEKKKIIKYIGLGALGLFVVYELFKN